MRIIETILNQTAQQTQDQLEAWQLLGNPKQVVFIDIETTGFSRLYDSIYLIGLVYWEEGHFADGHFVEGHFVAKQYLAGSLADEVQVLEKALDQLQNFKIFVTYNGDMFDLPFIEERAKRLRVWRESDRDLWESYRSVDLMRRYRIHQSFFGWPNMKLKTLEAFLGIDRRDPFDGGQLIEVFYEYARTDDERLEKVLLLHNYEDIVYLLPLLKIETFTTGLKTAQIEEVRYEEGELLVFWDRPFALSHHSRMALNRKKRKDPDYPKAEFIFEAGNRCSRILLPWCYEPVYYYLPNAKDYYFLPEKGEIVHKSLAFDVPSSERRKAKPCECVLCGQGSFVQALPAIAGLEQTTTGSALRCYKKAYKDADIYVEEKELKAWLDAQKPDVAAEWVRQFFEIL